MKRFVVSLLLSISVGSAERIQTQQQRQAAVQKSAVSISFDEDSIVKDERYVDLRQKREDIYNQKSVHSQSEPSRVQGEYYWETETENNEHGDLERCCCPRDTKSGAKVAGMKCQYLHAFRDSLPDYMQAPLGLKRSSNFRSWNDWVCPGTTGVQDGRGWHHPEDNTDDAVECEVVKVEIRSAQAVWQEEEDALNDDLSAVEGELRDLIASWGCQIVPTAGKEVDGTYCGAGGLTNVHKCKGSNRCYTTACYTCTKSGNLFYKRLGDAGMVTDEATGKKYVSTSGAVRAHALEQCRSACILHRSEWASQPNSGEEQYNGRTLVPE